ncbi:MAG: pyridoxamine 5'-phosphate oxidase family protein [Synergistaceae bacterium]|nr:pyridoxamine 5'-phosphate oxidase family protein [Synergistaceae bacterium]
MVITDEVKRVVEGSAFLSLVTLNPDGTPHPIIVGKGEVSGDNVVFGIYKMSETQKNVTANNKVWVVAATTEGGPKGAKGYRLSGVAKAAGKQLIFTPDKVEALL